VERFYDPTSGQVLFDDVDIRDLNVQWYRQQIGFVQQEPILFSGTIFENIGFGKQSATKEEIESAAKLANAHDFISRLPQGYQTTVGEQGLLLSGGQRQRIAIA
jgi:ABC-type multidrug transport system fused ATPase/permease subunit